jgi:hypothetical protein
VSRGELRGVRCTCAVEAREGARGFSRDVFGCRARQYVAGVPIIGLVPVARSVGWAGSAAEACIRVGSLA